ncbi:MAG: glycosyltransferase [Nitrospirae bacterium]|nr:glycosyltransferase [Nitrospirota bacterium]
MPAPAAQRDQGGRPPRICYFGTYSDQQGYPMNRVLLAGLAAAGAQVIPCHERVFADAADKMAGVGRGGLGRALRLAAAWLRLARKFAALPDYDVLVVGYLGHLDIFLARFLGLFRPRPVVLNALISLHDTVVTDRGLVRPGTLAARTLAWIDRTAFRLADRVLIDTHAHGRFLAARHGIPAHKWLRVPVGADPEGLPDDPPPAPGGDPLTVLYFGTYIALHGVPTILDAARRLADRRDIRFVLVGRGQELDAMRALADGQPNITFDPRWVARAELLGIIAGADLVLGVFGSGGKAGRVVPCKVFDGLAMARPVITADTEAAREFLTDANAVLVPPGDGAALARAIAALADDPVRRAALAAAGHALFRSTFDARRIGADLLAALADGELARTRRRA